MTNPTLPPTYSAQETDRIGIFAPEELAANGWDQIISPDDVFLDSGWQAVVQQTADAWLGYLLASHRGVPQTGMAMALATVDVPWPMGRPDLILQAALEGSCVGAAQAALSLGCPSGTDATQRLLPSLTLGGRHLGNTRAVGATNNIASLNALIERAEAQADALGARSIAVPFLDETDTALAAVLTGRGYIAFDVDEYSRLDVPAGGLDDYLRSLPAGRRREALRERRRLSDAGLSVQLRNLDEVDHQRLAQLEVDLLAKYGTIWPQVNALRWLDTIQRTVGPKAHVLVGTAQGEIRSFALVYRHHDRWAVRQAGFDYDWQQATRTALYFETIFYSMVEAANTAGVHRIHYGLSSGQAKRSRGCTSSTQRCWIAPRLRP
jgi:hypothetical protein